MKYIGAHVSAAGGVQNAPLNAGKIGATAFALFLTNQRQWQARPLEPETVDEFQANLAAADIDPTLVLPHDSYLINLGSPDPDQLEKSYQAFRDGLLRADRLGLKLMNFHPGSHLGLLTDDACLEQIAAQMNRALRETRNVVLVIENTAGQGSVVGHRFEHLKTLIELSEDRSRVGVCLDTCHAYSAGYDLATPAGFAAVFAEFEDLVGFPYLRGMHLNDSQHPLGSRKDRHAGLGQGAIGLEAFRLIMADRRFDGIPLILETPGPELWAEEIALLASLQAGAGV